MGKYSKTKSKSARERNPQCCGNKALKILVWVLAGILLALIVFRLFFMPGMLYNLRYNEDIHPPQTTVTDQTSGDESTAPGGSTASHQESRPQDREPQNSEPQSSESSGSTGPSQSQQSAVSLPAKLDGGLRLENLFQFSGINPDAGNQEGTDIATILLKNISGTYLAKADLTLTLADGKTLTFTVMDLPSGQSAMAFSKENASVGTNVICSAVSCSTSFVPDLISIPAQVSVFTDGITVTLTNDSDQALSNLVVYCRGPLGEEYFGGISYQYIVKNIPPRGTVTVEAVDCILGMAEVVRVEINNE